MSRYHSHVAHGICRRCSKPFGFYQVTKTKFYCKGCRAKEKREAKAFFTSRAYLDAKRNKVAQIVVAS